MLANYRALGDGSFFFFPEHNPALLLLLWQGSGGHTATQGTATAQGTNLHSQGQPGWDRTAPG